jgi:CDP-diacylglycerol--serine O-phosphatidyltransferase
MNLRRYIPNTLTTCNLICGLLSVTFTLEGNLVFASLLVFIAAVFDYLDGSMARLLKAYSELGKQLDSLADLVSFGIAPGIIIFKMLSVHCAGSCSMFDNLHITPYIALLIPVCSALRLAKFNIDLRQEVNFIGLPTPANALFFASIPLVLYVQPGLFSILPLPGIIAFFSNTRILVILIVFFSYLLISDFRIFSMKFKTMKWEGHQLRYIFLLISLVLIFLFFINAFPIIIALYVLMSIFFHKEI